MKFKVGDRVRVANVSDKHAWIKHLEGVSGVVKKVFKCANQDVGCYDIGLDYIINEPELELISPKFKVGDRVRIIAANLSQDKTLIGDIYTVNMVDASDCSYILNDRCKYIWCEDELELVKPKFNINDYPGKCVMHVKTEEEAKILTAYLTSVGIKRNYRNSSGFGFINNDTCVRLDSNYHADKEYYKTHNYTILEFEDFDWSDFTMKKNFTKADLKNGDVVKKRNGEVEIVCIETGTLICSKSGFNSLSSISEDLTYNGLYRNSEHDIVAVRRPNKPQECRFDNFDTNGGTLVYERKEVEEMTLAEVCKALGKEIKIVKERN